MEVKPDNINPPFSPSLVKTKTPEQGGVSKTYTMKDEKTGEVFVHKVMNTEKTGRYGDSEMPILEKAQILQRIHGAVSKIFGGKVAPTQFIIAKSEGKDQIEIVQPFIEGAMVYDLPLNDRQDLHDYIKEKSGETENLTSKISTGAGVPMEVAKRVAYEIKYPGNWVKNLKTGETTLVDF